MADHVAVLQFSLRSATCEPTDEAAKDNPDEPLAVADGG